MPVRRHGSRHDQWDKEVAQEHEDEELEEWYEENEKAREDDCDD
jgi:hypothetical protein